MNANLTALEWLGHGASILVLISLSMSSLEKLRWFNLAGATAFAVYGWLLGIVPVVTVNAAIVCINIYYLFRMYRQMDYFELLVTSPQGQYLTSFLKFFEQDIRKHYPSFSGKLAENSLVVLSLRNMAVAGVFVATPNDEDEMQIVLDYVVPQHADRRVGRHLYQERRLWFYERGIRRLVVDIADIRNSQYFEAMGFVRQEQSAGTLSFDLTN